LQRHTTRNISYVPIWQTLASCASPEASTRSAHGTSKTQIGRDSAALSWPRRRRPLQNYARHRFGKGAGCRSAVAAANARAQLKRPPAVFSIEIDATIFLHLLMVADWAWGFGGIASRAPSWGDERHGPNRRDLFFCLLRVASLGHRRDEMTSPVRRVTALQWSALRNPT
jgi:hypothetical protein